MSNPDELEDGLLYDYEETVEDAPASDEGSTAGFDAEGESASERKRPLESDTAEAVPEAGLSKRQKKLQKKGSLLSKKREQIQYEIAKRKSLASATPEEVSEYFATVIRGKNPDLSALELEGLYLKKNEFLSSAGFTHDRDLDHFQEFMTQFSRAPRALILCMSNMRVADVTRALGGSKTCLKLFAKNKLEDDVARVEEVLLSANTKNNSNKKNKKLKKKNDLLKFLVTTPTRLSKILESTEALFQGKDKLDIILDASFLDAKDQSVLTFENNYIMCQTLRTVLDKKSSVKILSY
ncbi:Cms1p KNAG_0B05160 [Huiozyma naganishii CBS 8797]|uniref:Protein CMS1 n=1 Tax=Huiozyma naganishii (strain ATCC MYA-139 / BCRC 22969 / CBS 8797 / KCTC 17520 / NBRC 10181 / NCYC 3082 / Yp74L-3) TaxID=1071383 RepID=J7RHD1_HUIN7|nr:hypothetical protein KNAG_0B05160 [Kazachstania naganishii CBS 8797]CCK68948.1 hypothetical protein KNAG_0B05160 [Kazachstania naganishii CBS 8797]